MIADATKYEKLLEAKGVGVFGKVEYEDKGRIILRTMDVKTSELSGTVRIYFDNKREQMITGRRFEPMGSGLILMRPGAFYRVYTTMEIVKPLPPGVSAAIVLTEEAADVMMATSYPLYEGFVGPISFMIQPYRRVEMEKMTSIARLVFSEETVNIDDEWLKTLEKKVLARVEKAPNSVRTKKSTKPKQGEKKADASSVSDESSGST